MGLEADSIEALDIFAQTLVPDLDMGASVPSDNPLARFLQDLAESLPAGCSFDGWEPDFGPSYRICESEVLELVDGNERAAEHLLNGRVGLHEIPADVNASENPQRVAEWIIEMGSVREAEAEAALEAWRAKLDLKQKQVFEGISRRMKDGKEKSK